MRDRRGTGCAGRLARVSFFALVCLAPTASAEAGTLLVERRPGEPVQAGVVEYEQACDRLGVRLSDREPVGLRSVEGEAYVQVEVSGEPGAARCGPLVAPRQLLRAEDVVETPLWPLPETSAPSPSVGRWQAADEAVLDALVSLGLDTQLDVVEQVARTGPQAAAVPLERIASDARFPSPVRRAAVRRLTPEWSSKALSQRVEHDEAWPVRLEAAYALLPAIERALLPGGPDATPLERLLVDRVRWDVSEVVRRNVLVRLPGLVVGRHIDALRPLLRDDSPNVRAAAVEAFAAAALVTPRELTVWLEEDSVAVRAAAGAALARLGRREDAPRLWRHLSTDVRAVRLAVSPLLDVVDDATVGPILWRLLAEESLEPEPEEPYRRRLSQALERRPFDALAPLVAARLEGGRPLHERMLLATLLSTLDAARARDALAGWWKTTERDRRLVAAAAGPDDLESRERRRALLTDPDDDVRAAAVIGLCRWAVMADPTLDEVELPPHGFGPEAMRARSTCGVRPLSPRRWRTSLEAPAAAWPTSRSTPAAALVLLGLGFVLTRPGTSPRTRRRSPGS